MEIINNKSILNFINNMTIPFVVSTLSGEVLYANDEAFNLFQVSREKLKEINTKDFYLNIEDRKRVIEQINKEGFLKNFKIKLRKYNGDNFDALMSASKYIGADGEEGLILTITDISEIVEKDKKLALFGEVIFNTPHFVLITDEDFNLYYKNKALSEFCAKDYFKFDELPFFDNPEELKIKIKEGLHREKYVAETVKFIKDGKKYTFAYVVFKVEYNDEYYFVFIFKDITYQITLEEELSKRGKVEVVERVLKIFSHKINDALTGIQSYITLAENETANEKIKTYLDKVHDIIDDISSMMDRMMLFIKVKEISQEMFLLDDAIREFFEEYRDILGETIELKLDLNCDCSVNLNKDIFKNIIFSMVMNSIEALESVNRKNKTIIIKTYTIQENDKDFAAIEIYDNGKGIKQEDIEKIFEPFFTTKHDKHGIGLDLAMVYGYITNNDGTILVESKEDEYTKFTIKLPIMVTEKGKERETNSDKMTKIFILDDEEVITFTVGEFLKSNGYDVVVANSLNDAKKVLEELDTPFDLIISDIILNDGKGYEFVNDYIQRFGFCRIIYISGYSDIEENHLPGSEHIFIRKPFKLPELLKKVEELLES